MTTGSGPGRPPLAMVAALAALTLVACVGPEPEPDDRPETAADALALAGLTLPQSATQQSLDSVDDSDYEELYRVGFVAPAADARAFCTEDGLGGDVPARSLSSQQTADLGPHAELAEGSRTCGSVSMGADHWNRTVLFSGNDPATVWVAVGRMGR